ncbi:unnamed protein product, partial [Mycena citricolor]
PRGAYVEAADIKHTAISSSDVRRRLDLPIPSFFGCSANSASPLLRNADRPTWCPKQHDRAVNPELLKHRFDGARHRNAGDRDQVVPAAVADALNSAHRHQRGIG